ncbi:UNVERIFIED_CONTAM: Retrovirus-related Pol polyprotein from transposon RE1, partial [Sesamum indicum]
QKAYKLYDLDNKVIVVSRDITFHEHVFPYQFFSTSHTGPIIIPVDILESAVIQYASVHFPLSSDSTPPSASPLPVEQQSIPTTSPSDQVTAPSHQNTLPTLSLRRSQRQSKPPAWLNDFQCHFSSSTTSLQHSHVDFPAALSTVQEPSSYSQAKGHKARLVTKGYNQVEGVDYVDRFSPVAKAVTNRTLLVVASSYSWPVHLVDINNAFLHGYLDENIYMLAPDGYSVQPGQVCNLKRSLSGLKQASRQWNVELTKCVLYSGFVQSPYDHYLFTQQTNVRLIALLVYVDDVLITCSSEHKITEIKRLLDTAFTIKDLDLAKYFLNLEIARSSAGMSITQHKFIRDILQDIVLVSARSASSPLSAGLKQSTQSSSPLSNPEQYRCLVGRLLYLGFTRPDISFGAQRLSQCVHAPCQHHLEAALHLVCYLKGCSKRGLFFPASNPFIISAYCDVD